MSWFIYHIYNSNCIAHCIFDFTQCVYNVLILFPFFILFLISVWVCFLFCFFGWSSCHGVLLQYQNLIKHTKITKWILIQVVLSIVFVCTEDNLSDMNTAVEVFVVEYFDVVLNGHQMAVNACIYAVFPNSRNDSWSSVWRQKTLLSQSCQSRILEFF